MDQSFQGVLKMLSFVSVQITAIVGY